MRLMSACFVQGLMLRVKGSRNNQGGEARLTVRSRMVSGQRSQRLTALTSAPPEKEFQNVQLRRSCVWVECAPSLAHTPEKLLYSCQATDIPGHRSFLTPWTFQMGRWLAVFRSFSHSEHFISLSQSAHFSSIKGGPVRPATSLDHINLRFINCVMSFIPATITFQDNPVYWRGGSRGEYRDGINLGGVFIRPNENPTLNLSTSTLTAQEPGRPVEVYYGQPSNIPVNRGLPIMITGTLILKLDGNRTHSVIEVRNAKASSTSRLQFQARGRCSPFSTSDPTQTRPLSMPSGRRFTTQ
jgi:hypothetical protein